MLGHYFRGAAELQESLGSFVCKNCRMKGSALSPESRLWQLCPKIHLSISLFSNGVLCPKLAAGDESQSIKGKE